MRHVVIIGNGIAGITAARGIRKGSDARITVISAESDHFYSRTALMYIYMGHMRYEDTKPYEDWFWKKNRIELLRAWVQRVDTRQQCLHLSGGGRLEYDVLLIASGSSSHRAGWSGESLQGVQGLYGLQDLQSMERSTRGIERAVVVGGGLIGVEMAEMLCSRGIATTFLVREPSWMSHLLPSEESAMVNRELRRHGVDLRLRTELARIEDDGSGRANAVVTTTGETIPCGFVGLTVGVRPNIGFLEGSGIEVADGVLVDSELRTNVDGVFAAGDCAELRHPAAGRRAVEPLWYIGRAMGEAVARTIAGQATEYVQDVWFNSAKFFDLEWQVYGDMPADSTLGIETLYCEDDRGRRCMRINFRQSDGAVTGFNLLGVRTRHELCDRWLRSGTTIHEVLAGLGAANFDPELFGQMEARLIASFNARFPERPVVRRTRRGLRSLLRRVS